jgi:N-acyl-D-amino-acid deacylase
MIWNNVAGLEEVAMRRSLSGSCLTILAIAALQVPREGAAAAPEDRIPVTGTFVESFRPIDDAVSEFLQETKTPGAMVSIARNGKVLYSRGFGSADSAQRPMPPDALCRIGSISKPITSAAIFRLIEDGKLSLDAPALDTLKSAGRMVPSIEDRRAASITIRQLLQHVGGWGTDKSPDVIVRPRVTAKSLKIKSRLSPDDALRALLQKPLSAAPGQRYQYSNDGYFLLGLLIEAASGKTYEQYCRETVLAPIGLTDMSIGKALETELVPTEVRYFDDRKLPAAVGLRLDVPVPAQYGGTDLDLSAAAGGWIATPIDLIRFAEACRGRGEHSLFTDATRKEMFQAPKLEKPGGEGGDYACGWNMRRFPGGEGVDACNFWHHGSIDGASSAVVSLRTGWTWAILCNTVNVPRPPRSPGGADRDVRAAAALSGRIGSIVPKIRID